MKKAKRIVGAILIITLQRYNRKNLVLNYVSMIYNFLLYLIMIFACTPQSLKFIAYVYLAETVAVIVFTKKFSRRIKSVQENEVVNEDVMEV